MRVLVKEGAERIIATTILTLPGHQFAETVLETLSGEGSVEGGFVAEVIDPVVASAISTAVSERHRPTVTARRLFEDVWSMARILAPYVIGSKVLLHVTATGCVLDCSRAVRLSSALPAEVPR